MKKAIIILSGLLLSVNVFSQSRVNNGFWRAVLERRDGKQIVFNIRSATEKGKTVLYIKNASEEMRLSDVTFHGDSVFFNMPVFESGFRAKIVSPDSLNGFWIRASVSRNIVLPFTATQKNPKRFALTNGNAHSNLSGKWAISFGANSEPAIGNFIQHQNKITGSVLTPTGDDRYLEGVVSGDSVRLSGFDGIHALLYVAKINGKNLDGTLYSGAASKEKFTAVFNDTATLPNTSAMYVKKGENGHLHFRFKDLNGNDVSINDERFENKVVVIDIMGSWCPNCMDETAFLSDFYNKQKEKNVEIIGLCYELTTDFERSKNSIEKFKKRFNVQYPLLITGVSVAEPEPARTEKTLPQLTSIKMFPTTIILDKTGKVRKIDTGFEGPATGEYYMKYVQEFNETIDTLLKE